MNELRLPVTYGHLLNFRLEVLLVCELVQLDVLVAGRAVILLGAKRGTHVLGHTPRSLQSRLGKGQLPRIESRGDLIAIARLGAMISRDLLLRHS